jgi:hypothetical protein
MYTNPGLVPLLGIPLFFWEILLDFVAVLAAVWSLSMLAWLDLEGALRGAFRWIVAGGMVFALLHLQDTLLRLSEQVSFNVINLIHIGSMLVVLIFLVLGLARLADAATPGRAGEGTVRWWTLAVGVAVVVGALSFILYGMSVAAVAWADWMLQFCLVLLTRACVGQVLRARLGGSVGRALHWAMLGLLVFSLVHPLQAWLFTIQVLGPSPYSSLLHRVFVIPAFLLFSISISALTRAWAPRELLHTGTTGELSKSGRQAAQTSLWR